MTTARAGSFRFKKETIWKKISQFRLLKSHEIWVDDWLSSRKMLSPFFLSKYNSRIEPRSFTWRLIEVLIIEINLLNQSIPAKSPSRSLFSVTINLNHRRKPLHDIKSFVCKFQGIRIAWADRRRNVSGKKCGTCNARRWFCRLENQKWSSRFESL